MPYAFIPCLTETEAAAVVWKEPGEPLCNCDICRQWDIDADTETRHHNAWVAGMEAYTPVDFDEIPF